MNSYWKNQVKIDVAIAILLTILLWTLPSRGMPIVFMIDDESTLLIARAWVGPLLTLLGMMSATTSFLFSVIDRKEFAILRTSSSESQLWRIFSENILWLGVASLSAVYFTFLNTNDRAIIVYGGTFLIVVSSISVVKFIWIMRQVISVRVAQSEQKTK